MNKHKNQKLQLTRSTVRSLSDVSVARGGVGVDRESVNQSCYEICGTRCPATNQIICHISNLAC